MGPGYFNDMSTYAVDNKDVCVTLWYECECVLDGDDDIMLTTLRRRSYTI